MFRKVSLPSLLGAVLLAVSLGGCSGDKSKTDVPQIKEKPPPNIPKKLTPGGAGGKQPGPGTTSQ